MNNSSNNSNNNIEKYITHKLIEYIRNYSKNLIESERDTSNVTFFTVQRIASKYVLGQRLLLGDFGEDSNLLISELINFNDQVVKIKNALLPQDDESEDDFNEEIIRTSHNNKNSSKKEVLEYIEFVDKRVKNRVKKSKESNDEDRKINLDQEVVKLLLTDLHLSTKIFLEKNPIEIPSQFTEIFKTFALNEVERELFQIVYIAEKISLINSHIFHADGSTYVLSKARVEFYTSNYASKKVKVQHHRIQNVTNIPHSVVRLNFRDDSKLFSTNLLENDDDPNLTEFVVDFLDGHTDKPLLDQVFEEVDLSEVFSLESTQLDSREAKNLKLIMGGSNGSSVLLKGVPGSGKTETAKALAKSLNVPLFILKHGRKKKDLTHPPRKMALYLIQELYKNSNAIFLIDECEDLINSQTRFFFFAPKSDDNLKSYINEYLDENKCNLIFIANHTEEVDDSTMRRFNYIVTFKEISSDHRERLLNNLFDKEKVSLLSPDEIRSLSVNSNLNIGHYGLALKSVKYLNGTTEDKKSLFLDIINNHSKEFMGSSIKLKKISKKYSLEGLNTDHPLVELTDSIVIKHKRMIESDTDTSLNIFLSGPPGTGKTEYVKHLAERLQKRLIIKQGSDLKDKYVGETEKRIKAAFLEAQDAGAMLFIDEIDSIMYSREMATQSWEIGQVNEILVNLENFKGIFIAASNSIDRMDPASLRRFLYKIKFDYLDKKGIEHFFSHFFGEYISLKDKANPDLSCLKKLTPSDFNTVKRKIEFEDNVSAEDIMRLLKIEMGYKGEAVRKNFGINL